MWKKFERREESGAFFSMAPWSRLAAVIGLEHVRIGKGREEFSIKSSANTILGEESDGLGKNDKANLKASELVFRVYAGI